MIDFDDRLDVRAVVQGDDSRDRPARKGIRREAKAPGDLVEHHGRGVVLEQRPEEDTHLGGCRQPRVEGVADRANGVVSVVGDRDVWPGNTVERLMWTAQDPHARRELLERPDVHRASPGIVCERVGDGERPPSVERGKAGPTETARDVLT